MSLAILLLFSSGMAIIAIGLLIALLRFRLWEADTVITRSAAYAVVTLIVGVVWAATSDLVKMVITELMGRESEAGATTVGAIIAAGIFLAYSIRGAGLDAQALRRTARPDPRRGETAEELGIDRGAGGSRDARIGDHRPCRPPNASAIVLDTAMGQELHRRSRGNLGRRSAT